MSQTGHICVPPLFLDSPGKPCMKWKGWLRAFENYIISIDGQGYSPERKKSLLFGLLGKAGQEVFDSLPVYVNPHGATAPLNEYQEAVRRLELQYAEECNIMVGRHKFALRKQEEGETIEEYIACLRVLAQDCEFAVMTDTKLGHFAAVCKAKKYNTGMKVSSVSENDTDADADMVLSIDGEDGRVKGPIGSVMIGVIKLPFTADSGSPLTLISDRTFDSKWQDVRLHETDWYDMNREIEAESDERLRVKARIVAKQENNKRYADMVNRAKTKNIAQGDWVLVKKPNRVMKGESVFQTPVRVQGVTRGAVCLEGAGWRSKDDIVRLKAGQEKIIMKDVRVDGAEGTDDVDEWQTHEARDVVIDEEECVNTPSRPGISGQASAERCEKAWRGLTAASGQNGCRPESGESDSHNVMGSSLEDACAVKANSLQYVTPSRPIRRIRAPKRFEDFVMRRLMTPRPICNEDGRDVRGRRGGKAEARRKRGVAAGRLLVGLISCGKNKRY
ncbi:hypothetical protein NDU88_008607 [Pleurodeles waltl]|uniref:Uncharacterized protein n=1 Tax=Pleurodeles waltl TaxID=8319 RepID=A0AAV7NZG3_PLEWA|nr:hypothetical protein NDU88_008607 [Pleurodeles waltl]